MNKPNIIFILIDDMGYKDLSCYGSTFYETPNIDSLAKEGMLFTDAYAACPVCSPTRASILSGKYPATLGLTNWIDHSGYVHPSKGKLIDAPYIKQLPLSEKSLATALKEGKYKTWHVGKWHLGTEEFYPEKHGFDINIAGCHRGAPKTYFCPFELENLEDKEDDKFLTDRLTDEAINLIKNNDGTPFFLYFSHYAVHIPLEAPADLIEKYKRKRKELGLDNLEELVKGEKFPFHGKADQRVIRRLVQGDPVYAALIENLDTNIGRLLDEIKKQGLEDDTIIVFTSDNGGLSTTQSSPTCNAPLAEGKGWMYEGGVREPLIIKWPKTIKANSVCDIPVTSPDFYPTFLEAANLPLIPLQHTDGVSILPLLKGEERLDRDAIYWHYPHYGGQGGTPGSSVRMGNYKLLEFFEDGRLELYNLKEDISEKHNLVNELPELTNKMHNMLKNWRESINALYPDINKENTIGV